MNNREVLRVVAGASTNLSAHLHLVMIRDLFPLLDKSLSLHALDQTTQTFGLVLLSQILDFIRDCGGPISLTKLTNELLFNATNLVLFGTAFSSDTYRDFRTLSKSVPYRFSWTLLWRWPSYAARMRLLRSIRGYLQQGDVPNSNNLFCPAFIKVFRENKLQSLEGARLALSILWALHSNLLNISFFSLSFLLSDPDSFVRVRAEVDAAVDKFGGLEKVLRASPSELDDPSLQLVTSVIMETTRLTGLHGLRQATCDMDLRLNDSNGSTISIKGEFVFENIHAAHMDTTVFSNPKMFVVDRFAQKPYQKKRLQTEGCLSYYGLGGGRNICMGRWLAVYELKVLLIALVHMFDFTPAEENAAGWPRPRFHPRSTAIVHTDDDVFVRLSLRRVKDEL